MSNAYALVRFPDGEIRHTIYHGTSDTLIDKLFESSDAAWAAWREGNWVSGPVDETKLEPVAIYSDYGYGFWWEGKATREGIDPGSCDPWHGDARIGGKPEWVVEWEASL